MAETCTLSLRVPSWRLRRRVRKFVRGEQVLVEDVAGNVYPVEMKRDQLVLSLECVPCRTSQGAKGVSGQCT